MRNTVLSDAGKPSIALCGLFGDTNTSTNFYAKKHYCTRKYIQLGKAKCEHCVQKLAEILPNNTTTDLAPYNDSLAVAHTTALIRAARIPGIPCKLFTPHVSWIFSRFSTTLYRDKENNWERSVAESDANFFPNCSGSRHTTSPSHKKPGVHICEGPSIKHWS